MKKLITNRRMVLAGAAASLLAAPAVVRAQSSRRLLIGDAGGAYTAAWTAAYYEPFSRETGIEVVPVIRKSNPLADIKAQVEARQFNWDLTSGITSDIALTLQNANLVEKLEVDGPDISEIPANLRSEYMVPSGIVTFVLAKRTDTGHPGPKSFADMWDVKGFPGRRAMRKFARDTLEIAARAAGLNPRGDLYSVLATEPGTDKVFAKLDELRKDVRIWWENSPQSQQILQTGEADICPAFSGRAQAAIDAGAPVEIVWNDGFYSVAGWMIAKGAPNGDIARKFIAFCSRADRQAAAAAKIADGPPNPNAFKHLSKERARILPSFPDNFALASRIDDSFWAANGQRLNRRVNEWLLRG